MPEKEAYGHTIVAPKPPVLVGWRTGNKADGGHFGSPHFLIALKTFYGIGMSDEEAAKGNFECTFTQAVVCAHKVKTKCYLDQDINN